MIASHGGAPMPTRNVVITPHQAALIDELVREGSYQNASEVMRDGLRLVEARKAARDDRLRALREAVAVSVEAADRGDGAAFEAFDQLGAYLAQVPNDARARQAVAHSV